MNIFETVYSPTIEKSISILLRSLPRQLQREPQLLFVGLIVKLELVGIQQLVFLQTGVDELGRDDGRRIGNGCDEFERSNDMRGCKMGGS